MYSSNKWIIGNVVSKPIAHKARVPQGLVLGSTLLVIYVNGIMNKHLNSNIYDFYYGLNLLEIGAQEMKL